MGGIFLGGITVILPAFNEEVSIGSVVLRVRQHADRVIVVDDGSFDSTAEVARMAGAETISHPQNMGKGAALRTGFCAAVGADIVVTIDSDGQHNPDEIPRLVAPIMAGEADIVNGSRYLGGRKTSTPLYRRAGQVVLDKVTNMECGLKITDTQSGFRAFAGYTMGAFRFEGKGLEIESEMLADAAESGFRVAEVEIGVRYDVNNSKKNPLSHGVGVLLKLLHDMELRRPLYYFTMPGMITASVGIGMGFNLFREFYITGLLDYGPMTLMMLLTIVGSFMAFTGLILHSISKVIDQSMRKIGSPVGQIARVHTSGRVKHEYIAGSRNPTRDN